MKISMSTIYIITTLFCVLPCIYFIFIGKKNTNNKDKLFKDTLKDENVSLSLTEQWNNKFLGFDESKNMLLFMKLMNQEVSLLKIDLNQIKSCQINKKTRDVKKENKMQTELQSLSLEFLFLKKNEIITFNFYDINDDFSQDLEIERADKWQTLIDQKKPKTSANRKAA
jgi:hypothetical protein